MKWHTILRTQKKNNHEAEKTDDDSPDACDASPNGMCPEASCAASSKPYWYTLYGE